MAAGKPLASYENPSYCGPRSLARTSMTGAPHELTSRLGKIQTIETAESLPGTGKTMNLRYRGDNQGSQLQRPFTRSVVIGRVTLAVQTITKSFRHQEVQQD